MSAPSKYITSIFLCGEIKNRGGWRWISVGPHNVCLTCLYEVPCTVNWVCPEVRCCWTLLLCWAGAVDIMFLCTVTTNSNLNLPKDKVMFRYVHV